MIHLPQSESTVPLSKQTVNKTCRNESDHQFSVHLLGYYRYRFLSLTYRQNTDVLDAQAYLSLCWAHTHFVGFVMSRLIC